MSKLESRLKLSGVKAGRVKTKVEVKFIKVGTKTGVKVEVKG